MPLSMLIVIVIIGLAVVIGAVHVFGGERAAALDEHAVRDIWRYEFGEESTVEAVVSDDRTTGFLKVADNAIGLVRQMGAHHIVRRLDAGSVNSVQITGRRINLNLTETTLPRLQISIDDDSKRAEVIAMLENLIAGQGASHA